MVRLVLIAALAGCYAPDVGDCVDKCDSSNLCPDGLTCQAGYCRADGASGTCASAMDMPDAAGSSASCPPVPMQQGCTLVGPTPIEPYCYAACAVQSGSAALAFAAGGSWHAAVLDMPVKMMAASVVARGSVMWIGLSQAASATSPAAGWSWVTGAQLAAAPWAAGQPDDGDGTENGTEQCATLTGSAFTDEPCSASHVFVIEP